MPTTPAIFPLALCAFLLTTTAWAERKVRVFIALCDNKTQGILPVGEKIGNGDDPDANLYWGCADGFGSYFKRSKNWKIVAAKSDLSQAVLRKLSLQHATSDISVIAEAYRGSQIRACIEDFESAAASGEYDLVAFIGHNGLMDFNLPEPEPRENRRTDAIVLCCMSDSYFSRRLRKLGCRPILTTRQLMYPGSFILSDVIEAWKSNASLAEIRRAAGKAYARNQKISVKAGSGIFASLEE